MEMLNLNVILVMVMVVASMEFHPSLATDHFVGDSAGWGRQLNPRFYEIWSINNRFLVNDALIFKFATGVHTVAEVRSLGEYDACDGSNPVQMFTNCPARVGINTKGQHYYICTIGNHCHFGMKMILNTYPRDNNSTLAEYH